MDFLLVALVAFSASALTFFSGFGLGTILLPVFALFFPATIAVAATGIVHLLNNLFKGTLVRKQVNWPTVLKFGLPAIPAAILGAFLLTYVDEKTATVVIGITLIVFSFLELQPWFQRITFPFRLATLGGVLTGFMGGLTGQQGALRSMFLLKSGFSPQQYVATGVLIAVLIDFARIPTYIIELSRSTFVLTQHEILLILTGIAGALLGALVGAHYVKKVTISALRYFVAALMVVIGLWLITSVLAAPPTKEVLPQPIVSTFEECMAAGYPIVESSPRQCRGSEGSLYTEMTQSVIPPPDVVAESWGTVYGSVLLGPTCPVERDPPDPSCADRPYETRLTLTTEDGTRVIREFSSNSQGTFSIEVPPGTYSIRSAAGAPILPSCASTEDVRVPANDSVQVDVSCDSGIR